MADILPSAILTLRDEFQAHVNTGKVEPFKPSMQGSMEISRLTRDLETKRETGMISDSELSILSNIDTLWEEIFKFNNTLASKRSSVLADTPPAAYDFQNSEFRPEKPMSTTISPNITEELADDIISDFEKQFQEKVMGEVAKNKVKEKV